MEASPAAAPRAMGPTALLDLLKGATRRLGAAGVEDARLEAERLLAHVLGTDRLRLYLDFDRPLGSTEQEALSALLDRRTGGNPLAYVVGSQPFRGIDLRVAPGVLVPRPETEEVVDAALEVLDRMESPDNAPTAVLDLCTGTGCIALALAAERPGLAVTAVERAPAALELARENAARAGLGGNFRLLEGDLYEPLGPDETFALFNLIIANPPYLTPEEWDAAPPEVRAEPREALVGGADGLEVYRRILAGAPPRLAPGGAVVLEIGWTQGPQVRALAEAAGFSRVDVRPDLGRRDRIVVAGRG
jgi:release factor glutamine methyltransferase